MSSDHAAEVAVAVSVMDALQHLTRRQREVFVLSALCRYSGPEIARLLHISEPTVRVTLKDARDRLAPLLSKSDEEPTHDS
jgi:RNA polymerase sigma factor (sigma-70 family)